MFKRATKKQQKARVCLIGAAGSGKTYTALTIAKALGTNVAVIDTERGSASKYAGDVADFDACELGAFAPDKYIAALHNAARAGYDVVVIDSLSHAWEGEGGILDQVDQKGGRFDAWKDMAPQMRQLIEAILTYPGHVVATLRTKTEYVIEDQESRGRTVKVPRKIGLAPKFKDGLEYEFDLVATMDDAIMRVSKSRCQALNGATIKKPGADVARTLREWLDDGETVASREPARREDQRPAHDDAALAAEADIIRERVIDLAANSGEMSRDDKGRAYRALCEDGARVGVSRDQIDAWAKAAREESAA